MTDKGKLYSRGLETVRRDVSGFVAKTYAAVLDAIINKKDIDLAQEVVHKRLCDLEDGKIPMDEFEISVQMKGSYKSTKLPQLTVARKMKARNPGSEPSPGDRFKYAIIDTGNSQHAVSDKAEDMIYIQENKLPIDFLHYLEALKNPLGNLFEAFTDDCSVLFTRTENILRLRKLKTGDISQFITGSTALVNQIRERPRLPPKTANKPKVIQRDLRSIFSSDEEKAILPPPSSPSPPKKKPKTVAASKTTTTTLSKFLFKKQ